MRNFLSTLFIIVGLLIIFSSIFFIWRRNDPKRLQFTGVEFTESTVVEGNVSPVGIKLTNLGINLPLIYSGKNGDKWETTSEGVSYLKTSPLPGEVGNAILYGHNWRSILGNLYKSRPGDKIEIYFSDNTTKEFEVAFIQEVTPDDSSVLRQTTDKRITLYTCSGLFDQKRFVVTAIFSETSHELSRADIQ